MSTEDFGASNKTKMFFDVVLRAVSTTLNVGETSYKWGSIPHRGDKFIEEIMREKGYIILGRMKSDNTFVGYTEHSFSMGVDSTEHVRVWRSSKKRTLYSATAEEVVRSRMCDVKELNKKHPDIEWSLYRVGSKDCPVKIKWSRYHNLKKHKNLNKFDYRNLVFEKK